MAQSAEARADDDRGRSGHRVLQFDHTLAPEERETLASSGVRLVQYLGDHAWFAHVAGGPEAAAAANAIGLADSREIDRSMKLHPRLLTGDFPAQTRFPAPASAAEGSVSEGTDTLALCVLFHADVKLEAGAALVRRLGGEVRARMPSINAAIVWLPAAMLDALAGDDSVQWLEPPLPPLDSTNDSNRSLTGANVVQAAPYSLNGSGINVLVYDGGTARNTHVDFGGRLFVRESPANLKDHPTHVSGTIGGDGTASSGTYRGMAPAVTIQSYEFEYDGTGVFLYTNPGDIEADYSQAINTYGVVISNNSIGTNIASNGFDCTYEGDYGATEMLIDAIVRGSLGSPMRIVWAAGNERGNGRCGTQYGTIPPPAGAKNHISVGAVNSDTDAIAYFSSWGPTDDGRLKPDVSAPGCQGAGDYGVTSTDSTGAYTVMCGTSMAAPTVTGLSALLLQDYKTLYPGQPLPRNSTLKILLAHNAVDLGNTGPDYKYGYGSVRVQNSIDFLRTGNFREASLDQGQTKTYYVEVPAGTSTLKATIAWDDPPGAANVIPELVNDLDVVAVSPSGTIYYPWTLDPANPGTAAVRTKADHLNNIEQVLVSSPQAGYWTVRITGTAIAVGPQTFSIAASPNLFTCSRAGSISLNAGTFGCTRSVDITVNDCDLNLNDAVADTVTVQVTSTHEPAGESVSLTETAAASAQFKGTIQLGSSDAAGILWVANGDTIQAVYSDADNGSGQPATVQATATVDCAAPAVSGFDTSGITWGTAVVAFTTDTPAQCTLRYGTVCGTYTSSQAESGYSTTHTFALDNLAPATAYFLVVDATDAYGNAARSDNSGACYTFTSGPAPVCLFSDQFPTSSLNSANWSVYAGIPSISTAGVGEPSEPYSLNLNGYYGNEIVKSRTINMAGLSHFQLSYWYERGGAADPPEAGDDLIVEYLGSAGYWKELARHPGSGLVMTAYAKNTVQLPPDAYHAAFAIRFWNNANGYGIDDWFVDDVQLCESICPPVNSAFNVLAYPAAICNGGGAMLTAAPGSGGDTVVWYTAGCGVTLVGTGTDLVVAPTTTTTYYVLTRNSATGCMSDSCVSATVTVNPKPGAPTGVAASPGQVCTGQSTTLSATPGTYGNSLEWFTGGCGVTLVGTGNSVVVSPTQSTTYYVRTLNTTSGCVSACTTVLVEFVSPIPAPGTPSPADGATSVRVDSVLEWDGGGTAVSASAEPPQAQTGIDAAVCPVTYDVYLGTQRSALQLVAGGISGKSFNPGPLLSKKRYYWKVIAHNCCGSAESAVWSFTTLECPAVVQPPSSVLASPASICLGGSTVLSGTPGTGGDTVAWYTASCGGQLVGQQNSLTVTPTATTTYYARTWNSVTGCVSSTCVSVTVTVSSLPGTPTGLQASPSTICMGISTTLTGTPGAGGDTLEWFSSGCGGVLVGTGTSVTVSPTTNTVYFARTKSSSSGCVGSTCANVTVTVAYPLTPSNVVASPSTVCQGSTTTLSAIPGSGGDTIEWFTGGCGTTSIGIGTSLVVTPPTSGTIYYARTRVSGTGCLSTSCGSVTVYTTTPSSPTGLTASPNQVCEGGTTTLSAVPGNCGDTVQWFTGSCGGTLVGTGTSLQVSASARTTYYARTLRSSNGLVSASCTGVIVGVRPLPPAAQSPSPADGATCVSNSTQLSWADGVYASVSMGEMTDSTPVATSEPAAELADVETTIAEVAVDDVALAGVESVLAASSQPATAVSPPGVFTVADPLPIRTSAGISYGVLEVTGTYDDEARVAIQNIQGLSAAPLTWATVAASTGQSLLDAFDVIYFPVYASSADYASLRSAVAAGGPLDQFATLGGVLVLNVAGVAGSQADIGPGGADYNGTSTYVFNYVSFNSATHPYVTGGSYGGTHLTTSQFNSWSDTVRGLVTSPVAGTTSILMNTTATSMLEYPYGSGRVIVSSLTFALPGGGIEHVAEPFVNLVLYAPASVGLVVSHDVYFGTAPESLQLICQTPDTHCTPPGPLTPGTTYYWKVVPSNLCGQQATPVAVWSFTTTSTDAPIGLSATPATSCPGQSVTLAATPVGGDTIEWYTSSCGGTLVGTGSTLQVSPTSTTTYYARTSNPTTGCTSDCGSVVVTVPAVSGPYNPRAVPSEICPGQSSTLSATLGSGSDTIDWYSSSCGGTLVGSGTSLVVQPQATTIYYARGRSTATGCVSSICQSCMVTIGSPPSAPAYPAPADQTTRVLTSPTLYWDHTTITFDEVPSTSSSIDGVSIGNVTFSATGYSLGIGRDKMSGQYIQGSMIYGNSTSVLTIHFAVPVHAAGYAFSISSGQTVPDVTTMTLYDEHDVVIGMSAATASPPAGYYYAEGVNVAGSEIPIKKVVVTFSGSYSTILDNVSWSLHPDGLQGLAALLQQTPQRAGATGTRTLPLVGLDFDSTGASPQNWTSVAAGATTLTLSNLKREDGVNTNLGAKLYLNGTYAPFTAAINPTTVPIHTPPVSLLDNGFVSAPRTWNILFSGLRMSSSYRVYVFGLGSSSLSNAVTIYGGSQTPITFQQSDTTNRLWINGEVGSSGRTLESYAQVITPSQYDTSGQIVIYVSTITGGGGTSLAGIAIQEILHPFMLTYDVYWGTDNPPTSLLCSQLLTPGCGAGTLNPLTTYYWRAVARTDCTAISGPVWSLRAAGLRMDLDHDNDVDLLDFDALSACGSGPTIIRPEECTKADFDADGDVDLDDFGIFQRCYGSFANVASVECLE